MSLQTPQTHSMIATVVSLCRVNPDERVFRCVNCHNLLTWPESQEGQFACPYCHQFMDELHPLKELHMFHPDWFRRAELRVDSETNPDEPRALHLRVHLQPEHAAIELVLVRAANGHVAIRVVQDAQRLPVHSLDLLTSHPDILLLLDHPL